MHANYPCLISSVSWTLTPPPFGILFLIGLFILYASFHKMQKLDYIVTEFKH